MKRIEARREAHRIYMREYLRKRRKDPEYAAHVRELQKENRIERMKDPAQREKQNAYKREYRARKKAGAGNVREYRRASEPDAAKYSPWIGQIKKKDAEYFRVSVLDEYSMRWTVRAAGLTRKRAVEACDTFAAQGLIARMTSCKPRK